MSTALTRLARLARRAPVTVALAVVTLTVAAAFPAVATGRTGFGVSALESGRWSTVLSTVVGPGSAVGFVGAGVALAALGAVESRIGSRRTSLLLAGSHLIGALLACGIAVGLRAVGSEWGAHLTGGLAHGPAPAVCGVIAAAMGQLAGPLWRRRVRGGLVAVATMLVLYVGTWSTLLVLASCLGGLSLTWRPRARRVPREALPLPEMRGGVAVVVAGTALGPLLSAVSDTPAGLLSGLRYLMTSPMPSAAALSAACGDPSTVDDCVSLGLRIHQSGLGPGLMSLLPVGVLVVLAEGLRRGSRFAWAAATTITGALAVVAAGQAVRVASEPVERLIAYGPISGQQLATGLVAGVAQPAAVAVLLLCTRSWFMVEAPPGVARRATGVVVGTLAALAAAHLVVGYALRDRFVPAPGWRDLLLDLPSRFLPPGYLGEVETAFLPRIPEAAVLHDGVGPVFWAVALTVVLRAMTRTRLVGGDPGAARAVLVRGAGSSLSWSATWTGNHHWFDSSGRVAVAYRVIGRVALTNGEPFGAPSATTVDEFVAFCVRRGWVPCFYGIGEQLCSDLRRRGWGAAQVGEEAVVPLPGLAFTGKRWQDVRSALNRARKLGVRAEWIRYSDAPEDVVNQIRSISDGWLRAKRLPEMGFTLGGLRELDDDLVRCLVAVAPDGRILGVTSWMPGFDGAPDVAEIEDRVGCWTLDFMRRPVGDGAGTSFPGVMEFLIASAALQFQQERVRYLSLSGVPLARSVGTQHVGPTAKLIGYAGRKLEPLYGFRSLQTFKAKFAPEFRPIHVAWPDPAALPSIGVAVARSYFPKLTGLQVCQSVMHARERPVNGHRSPTGNAPPSSP